MTRLLQAVAPAMVQAVRVILGPYHADRDDVVQQSLIAFVQALPRFRGECEPASYGCRIAVRTALVERKRVRRDAARCEAAPVDVVDSSQDAEALRRKNLLRALLEEIPEEQAEALALRTVLGWSLEEIAAACGAPVNTIRSRMRLAKEALRKRIESEPGLAEELGVSS